MSTAIQLVPEAHATRRTTHVEIAQDGIVYAKVDTSIYKYDMRDLYAGQSAGLSAPGVRAARSTEYVLVLLEYFDTTLEEAERPVARYLNVDAKGAVLESLPAYPLWPEKEQRGPLGGTARAGITTATIQGSSARVAARRQYAATRILSLEQATGLAAWSLNDHVRSKRYYARIGMLSAACAVDSNLSSNDTWQAIATELEIDPLQWYVDNQWTVADDGEMLQWYSTTGYGGYNSLGNAGAGGTVGGYVVPRDDDGDQLDIVLTDSDAFSWEKWGEKQDAAYPDDGKDEKK